MALGQTFIISFCLLVKFIDKKIPEIRWMDYYLNGILFSSGLLLKYSSIIYRVQEKSLVKEIN